jgi:hypothetical protein
MKRFYLYIVVAFLLASCMGEPEYHSYSADLWFDFGEEVDREHWENAKVVFTNLQKSYSVTSYTDAEGRVSFDGVEPGFYSAQLSHSYVNEIGTNYYLNGLESYDLFDFLQDTIEVSVSFSNPFVIKEFYYSGCLTPAGKQYSSDQFVEIYNNSDEVRYVDGMSLIEHESYGLEPYYFSWLMDTIVCRMIWTIPGEGEDYPVQPGGSVVLARDAFDHKSDPLGNPLCPVDLGHADFEFYVYSATGADIDGPYSPNLIEDLFTFRGTDISFHVRGGSAIALVKIPGNDEERKEFIANNLILKDGVTSTRYYGKIPNKWVIDAVEVVFDEAHAVYKRFPLELDAGYTYNPEGSRSGKSLRRKVKEVVDGRVIYQDTNNSVDDFIKATDPQPWIYEH